MIPRGICVDLETTIAGKISNLIRPPGQKRFETRIIEIGAVHWTNASKRFLRLVNPIEKPLESGEQFIQHLKDIHQKPKATINFWSRVLVRRKSVDRTMFAKEEAPDVWLARRFESKANDFVRWFNGEHGPGFVSEKKALQDFIVWSEAHPWLAHNGNSFDFKVIQGASLRTGCPLNPAIKTYDTLKLFRKMLPGHKSYSQPILYENIFAEKYNAHVAIDDAIALSRLCQHTAKILAKSSSAKNLTKSSSAKNLTKSSSAKILAKSSSAKILTKSSSAKILTKSSSAKILTKRPMNLTFGKSVVKMPAKYLAKRPMNLSFGKSVVKLPTKILAKSSAKNIGQLQGVGPKSVSAFADANIYTLEQLATQFKIGGRSWLQETIPFGTNWKVIERSILTVN
jgi:DNA polymerase III epsilon subunit-like protein